MEALEQLKTQGKTRPIGASNTTPADVRAYLAAGQLDALQEEYSMLHRVVEAEMAPLCQDNKVSILSYSSLALGLVAGKIGPDRVFEGDDQRKDNPRFSIANREKVARLIADISPIAKAHGAIKAQTIIAWTL